MVALQCLHSSSRHLFCDDDTTHSSKSLAATSSILSLSTTAADRHQPFGRGEGMCRNGVCFGIGTVEHTPPAASVIWSCRYALLWPCCSAAPSSRAHRLTVSYGPWSRSSLTALWRLDFSCLAEHQPWFSLRNLSNPCLNYTYLLCCGNFLDKEALPLQLSLLQIALALVAVGLYIWVVDCGPVQPQANSSTALFPQVSCCAQIVMAILLGFIEVSVLLQPSRGCDTHVSETM